MPSHITYKYIRENADIMEYIRRADETLGAMGYTEHSFAHVEKVAHNAAMILTTLGYDERTIELAKIAGMMHDIGNVINRIDHAQSGAVMAFRILDNMNMPASEICSSSNWRSSRSSSRRDLSMFSSILSTLSITNAMFSTGIPILLRSRILLALLTASSSYSHSFLPSELRTVGCSNPFLS